MVMHSKPAGHKNETAKSCYEEINKLICKFARENLSVLKKLEKLGEPVGHSDYSVSVSSRVEPSAESGLRQLGQQKSLEQNVQCKSSLSVVSNSNVERKKKRKHDSKKNRQSVRKQKKREHRQPSIDRSRSSMNSRRQLPATSPDSSILERKSVELKSLRSGSVSSPIGSVRSNSNETVSTNISNMSRLFLSPTSSYVLLKKPEKTCTRRPRVACGCRCHSKCLVCANEKYAKQSPNKIQKEIEKGMERYVKLADTSTLSFKSTTTSEKSRPPESEKTCTRRTRVAYASGCRCQSKQCLVCANEKYARQSPNKIQREITRGMERYVKLGDTSTLSWKSISTSESARLSSSERSSDRRKIDNEDGIIIHMTDKRGKQIDLGFDAKMLITEKGRQTNRLCISTNLTNGAAKWVKINGELLWL